jgi:hypothetical protein
MSIGHPVDNDELDASSLTELFEALGSEDTPRLFEQVPTVNTDYDIPFGAGNSLDRKTVYIDRGLFAEVMRGDYNKTGLSPQQIIDCWIEHEHTEICLIEGDNPVDTYPAAHRRALAMEHRFVIVILGKDDAQGKVRQYEDTIWPGLERAYKMPERVPADLWCSPLINDVTEEDEKILKRMVELGAVDARKRSKQDTRYGLAKNRCDACRHWSPETMNSEQGQLASCRVVSGLVRNDRGCDFWMEGKERAFHPTHIGARQAPDGEFYIPDTRRPGKYLQVRNGGRGAGAGRARSLRGAA